MAESEAIGTGRQRALRGRRRQWLVLLSGAAILAVGLAAFLGTRSTDRPTAERATTTTTPADAEAPAAEAPLRKGGKLDGPARAVVERFVVATLGRTDLAAAWSLATPALRGAVTRAQWMAGELPIAPYPTRGLETTGYMVIESSPTKMLLQVLLVPKVDSGYAPIRYDMTIQRRDRSAPWKVSYFLPYAPPGMFDDATS